ncbi:MAG TPA: ParB/RepB/Spo0J family partition protein [Chloroflexia bacterium]|nr:ParB/RepB/Spo0J family partition protein [Chloroflexia bacterium]
MTKKRGGLGRGLGALIPQGSVEPEEAGAAAVEPEAALTAQPAVAVAGEQAAAGVLDVPVDSIRPNPHQPRQAIQPEQLEELAASMREHGVLQPLVVMRSDDGAGYTLIAGERRWRAARVAGLESVPAIVKEATPREMLELALVENLQRADLNPLEEAHAYQALVEEFGLKQEEVAERVGKSRITVTNALRLLKLPLAAQESLALGLINAGHARAILQVPDEEGQLRLMELAVADGLNVRQVEELARRMAEAANRAQEPEKPAKQETRDDLYDAVRELEDRFRNALGTKVQLSRSSRGGKLVIYFYSEEELDRIYGTIVGDQDE